MEVISTRRYEARAPANKIHSGLLYDPSNAVATVKEEEWETRKKKEITTTRQIETRVKRQVVLEDGAVVKDSGPLVTTNTTEDVEQQEHTTQERRTNGDEPKEVEWTDRSGDSAVVQKELNQTIVRSREEIEELVETEDRHQFGDITDETYQQAVRNNRGDLRISLAESAKQVAVNSGPRLVQHETKSNKVIDTEKTWERKELKADGAIVTETKKSVEHEEIRDNELPEDDKNVPDEYLEIKKESSQRFLKEKHEDVVDHVSGGERIARETRFVSEKTEGERIGDWPPPPPTMKTVRLPKPGESSPLDRKDALTKKPLDPEEEDEARKFETSKWLENHFGSESRSSHSDSIELNDPPKQTSTNTSFINVTMKSCTSRDRDYKNTSNSSLLRNPNRSNNRESSSPLGYFYGISEWSERYQGSGDKRNHNSNTQTSSPKHYTGETTRTTGNRQTPEAVVTYARNYSTSSRKHHETQQRSSPPSPPLRRRAREPISKKGERTSYDIHSINSSSPVNVTQRTWQSRNLEYPMEEKIYTCQKSRSPSPISKKSVRKELEKSNDTCETPRNTSKFKIGESFRKLVDKLRSASSERTNKKIATNSTSQLTQTDDSSTYLQYNVIDKNIPEIGNGEVNESIDKPPERPSRSPRVSSQPTMIKVTRSTGQKTSPNTDQSERNHKYGIIEETYLHNFSKSEPQDSRHDRINSYQERHGKSSLRNDIDNNCTSRTLGRLSKSTSRLTHEYDRDNYYPSILTLPRKLHSTSHGKRQQTSSTRRSTPKQQNPISGKTNQSRHYGSMINISIKNAVTSQIPPNSKTFPQQNDPPIKPERTYKSALLRSKSFNVEATNGGCKIPYKSSNQLNRLDQSQPLKSPGILASISRSNRDLFKHDYY